jgi:hypothetical protein
LNKGTRKKKQEEQVEMWLNRGTPDGSKEKQRKLGTPAIKRKEEESKAKITGKENKSKVQKDLR